MVFGIPAAGAGGAGVRQPTVAHNTTAAASVDKTKPPRIATSLGLVELVRIPCPDKPGMEQPDYLFLCRLARNLLRLLCFAIFFRRFFFTEPMASPVD